jgi:superfamily II DNA or RNA helicase
MQLRDYQREFINAVVRDFVEHQKVLGVSATGSGKTIIASALMHEFGGNCLFLADAKQLVDQNADKYQRFTSDFFVGVEMAEQVSSLTDRVVIATSQSLFRRVEKFPVDHFELIIIDEAHRNTLGGMTQRILDRFPSAKVLGMTATPWRADRQQLGEFYEKISIDISLVRLIKEGYLSPITIKSVPLNVDLDTVHIVGGDYDSADLGRVITPYLTQAARLLATYASDRKTAVFLPLIETSKAFVDACHQYGLRAVHVDGTDRDGIERFTRGEFNVISNAQLLSTGWDCPEVDCIYNLRATKSLSLYTQIVGRGTRIAPGKKDLLLLDPLFLTDNFSLIKPARLIAKDDAQAKALSERFDAGEQLDLIDTDTDVREQREAAMVKALAEKAKRKSRSVDAIEFFVSLGDHTLSEYEPEMKWERAPLSEKQSAFLTASGFDPEAIGCKGRASKVIDLLMSRRALGLATPKQVKYLRQFGYPTPDTATFKQATNFLNKIWKK